MKKNNGSIRFVLIVLISLTTSGFLNPGVWAAPPYDPLDFPQNFGPSFLDEEIIPKSAGNTGASSMAIAIETPPGRGEAYPELAMEYNSGHTNGWIGVGWDLHVGYIQRATKHGLDYSGTDFVVDGNRELVRRSDWGSDYYGAKVEEEFIKFRYVSSTSGWRAYAKDGRVFYYGRSADSRQDNANGVFKWRLDKVVDANGNAMTVSYTKDADGEIYLERIDYTGNKNYVIFTTETRPDPILSYRTHSRVLTTQRLSRIRVYGNSTLARQYDLQYEEGTSSGRSRLVQVDVTGLPPASMSWQEGGDGGFGPGAYTLASEGREEPGTVLYGDVNGDSRCDLIKRSTASGHFYTFLSNGDGTFGSAIQTLAAEGSEDRGHVDVGDVNGDGRTDLIKRSTASGHFYTFLGQTDGTFGSAIQTLAAEGKEDKGLVNVGDVNGDGRTDLIKRSTASGHFYTFFGQTDGTFGSAIQTLAAGGKEDPGWVLIGDVNGDGLVDLIKRSSGGTFYTYQSMGDGTFGNEQQTIATEGREEVGMVHVVDLNNDGLTDLVKRYTGGTFYSFLSLGDGTFGPGIQNYFLAGDDDPGWVDFADVNGDGLVDLIKHNPHYSHAYTFLGLGDGTFDADYVTTEAPGGDTWAGYISFGDLNGDGKQDLIKHSSTGNFYGYLSTGNYPDLMTGFQDRFGASTTLSYAPSSDYQNILLPFIVYAVTDLSIDDGNGVTSNIAYTYSGGYYDAPDREFRGFEGVYQTNPNDTMVDTFYHQTNDYTKGRDYRIDFRNPSDSLLTRVSKTWNTHTAGSARFVKLTRERHDIYDGDTIYRQYDYTYNNSNGNLTESTRSGTSAEDVTTAYTYANYGTWTWRKTGETVTGSTSGTVRDTTFEYESNTGNLLEQTQWLEGGTDIVVSWTYDSYGNPITETDGRGNTTTTEYDSATHTYPWRITRPATNGVAHVTVNEAYDYRFGKVTEVNDENNKVTLYSYDSAGRLTRIDYPDGGQVLKSYNDTARPRWERTRTLEAGGNYINLYEYFDGLNRKVRTRTYGDTGQSIYTRFYIDNMGRNYRTDGPSFTNGNTYPRSVRNYDWRGRITRVTEYDTEFSMKTDIDYDGLVVTVTDADSKKKRFTWDYLSRVNRVTEFADTGQQHTDYDYNAAGDLLSITDARSNTIVFDRDTLGRQRALDDPSLGYWTYTYDENSNLRTRTDAANQVITYTYDELNRLILKEYSTADADVVFTYDDPSVANGVGRLHSVENASATRTIEAYDEMGRPLTITRTITGNPTTFATSYTYEPDGKLESMTYPDGFQLSYSYHAGSGLPAVVSGQGLEEYGAFYGYNALGKPGSLEHENLTASTFTYDGRSRRLKRILTVKNDAGGQPEATLLDRQYHFTRAGDIDEIFDGLDNITFNYTYDNLHRLTSETAVGISDTFTPAILESSHDTGGPVHAPAIIKANGVDFFYDYDENGNMISGPDFSDPTHPATRTITYNAENMPVHIEWQSDAVTADVDFLYDGDNVRVRKSVQGGSTTDYIGEHYEVIDGQPIKYVFSGNIRLARISAAGVLYYHQDHLKSASVLTDNTGVVVETTRYMPFGSERAHSGQRINSYGFTDQEQDISTGLYNYDARLYDPVAARFVTADSIVQDWYDPQTLNRYAYTRNNPLVYIDPSGHAFWSEVIKGDYDTTGTTWGGVAGQVVIGFIPVVGQVADARDTVANVGNVWNNPGEVGAWVGLGGAAIAWVPGLGDLAKGAIKGGKKAATEVSQGVIKSGGEAASKKIVQFTDNVSKVRLRGRSLKSGRKKLLNEGLTERINRQTGRHEFVDSKGIVRAAYDPISQQGKKAGHWHKWAINEKHQRIPITDSGRITEKTARNAHIPK